jgi:hypothetical protein
MPTLSASDYTSFIKMQAAAQSYRNGAIPKKIQTTDQVVPTQSILNARLLASQASYVAASPDTVATVSSARVTAVANNILSAATTNIVTSAVGSTTFITYTTSVPHGLIVGDTISITNIATYTAANVTSLAVATVPTTLTFTVLIATDTTSVTGQTGQIEFGAATNTSVYYTSSVPHALTTGQSITVTGFTVYTVPNVTSTAVTRVINSTSFFISNIGTTNGSGTGTGSITGFIYYTTDSDLGTTTAQPNTTLVITGLATAGFNIVALPLAATPDSTHFVIASSFTGTALTGQSGVITYTQLLFPRTVILRNARIMPYNGKGYVNQPKALSTVHNSTSTVQSSGKFAQVGGLPLTSAKSDGVYAPVAHLARVDTKATGAYAKTIPGGSYTNNINTGINP